MTKAVVVVNPLFHADAGDPFLIRWYLVEVLMMVLNDEGVTVCEDM